MRKLALLLTFLFSLSLFASDKGQGVLTFKGVEVEKQNLDLIFVLDNSGSMGQHIPVVTEQYINTLKFLDNTANWRAAFITSDIDEVSEGTYFGFDGNFNYQTENKYDLLKSELSKLWHTLGSPKERLFDVVTTALNNESGFVRLNSKTVVIYVTDEDDQSNGTATQFITDFVKVAGKMPDFRLVGDSKTNPSCPAGTWVEDQTKLDELVMLTRGTKFGLCEEFATKLAKSLASSVKLELNIRIKNANNLEVYIDGVKTTDFTLVPSKDAIFIHGPKALKESSTIEVKFDL